MWPSSYHELQASSDRQSCELQAQLKIANFEKERASLATQESMSQLRQCQLDREKLQKKVILVSSAKVAMTTGSAFSLIC